ncbi:ADP-ribosylation factor [Phlyctema vagabunda]|uniref:ADP-ribosylation factor n=1 Tax=Phlyctema vagabunda TaxID=108571 RepID=A0ABR4PC61_9HELO
MYANDRFKDFDNELVFAESCSRALLEDTRNFVVEFGKEEVQIAFDLNGADIQKFNIWAPNEQLDIVDILGSHYKFSPRLQAIIRTAPEFEQAPKEERHASRFRSKTYAKDDPEAGTKSLELSPNTPNFRINSSSTSHYTIAKQMVSYQSVDIGPSFLCVGANWMHRASRAKAAKEDSIVNVSPHQRLWSWLVLCDDYTVISFHEDPGRVDDAEELQSMRSNTISVLSQLSNYGHDGADPVSLQSVRKALQVENTQSEPGIEGASNLFYYLFDDWRAVYSSIAAFQAKLESLQHDILGDLTRKSNKTPNIEIIPRLHMLGREIRVKQHLYKGYKNLIHRILKPTSMVYTESSDSRVVVAKSAAQRFERLSDRIELLILSEIHEFLVEKDALISTYFSINAQKDSESTARLTRSATLLAKLSVLFLPVSLMTAYFSVQIDDLAGVYTSRTYWTAFAIIMSISFASLFLLSKGLIWVTETLELWVKNVTKACKTVLLTRGGQRPMPEETR